MGESFDEADLVKKLMSLVPERFIQIIASIEQFLDLDTMLLPKAIGILKAFEERTNARTKTPQRKDDQVLLSYSEWQSKHKENESKNRFRGNKERNGRGRSSRGRGWYGKSRTPDHDQIKNQYKGDEKVKDKSKIKCFKCDLLGHYASECPQKNKGNEANLTKTYDDEPSLLMAAVERCQKEVVFLNETKVNPSKYAKEPVSNETWYLDNGASNHMTGNLLAFYVIDNNVGGKVKFGDGSTVVIEGRGSIILSCKNGEQRILTDVYYIPMLKNNMLSLGQATEGGCEIRMKGEFPWMYEKSARLLMKVQKSPNRLYKTDMKIGSPMCFHTQLDDEAWKWHGRLGHISFDTMKLMASKWVVKGLPTLNKPTKLCEACLAGKLTRTPFPAQSLFRSERPLELVSMDLCGPITPETQAGNRYFMLVVDDCTRYMWVYLLKTKDQAIGAFKVFKKQVENEFGLKIKCVRSDRGGEFTSNEFKQFCDEHGIKRQLTTPYTPQQNGMMEGRNRTVLNMTRSLLKAMSMPQNYWAEAVRHSIYLLNRIPTKPLTGKTPYEILKGRKPNLQHLRVFGCVAYVKVVQPHLNKLQDRSVPMVYLGTEEGTKGHRFYNPKADKLVIGRDVEFADDQKWDWSTYVPEGKDESPC